MSTFVLVHGAWHEGSAWADVVERLEQQGHYAFAPTLAGSGKGVCKQISHAQQTQSVIDYIATRDLTDIVLVGHSYGGTIISKWWKRWRIVCGGSSTGTAMCFWTAKVLPM
jgi:alpha-beta hydrolase superfamily lysophospholipase